MTMNREQEFKEQLERNDRETVWELVNNPEWEWLNAFYATHFDEISYFVSNCRSLRTVIEDICALEPAVGSRLIENTLFVYRVNVAIKNGVLRKENIYND